MTVSTYQDERGGKIWGGFEEVLEKNGSAWSAMPRIQPPKVIGYSVSCATIGRVVDYVFCRLPSVELPLTYDLSFRPSLLFLQFYSVII